MRTSVVDHVVVYRIENGSWAVLVHRGDAWVREIGNGLEASAIQSAGNYAARCDVTVTHDLLDPDTLRIEDLDEWAPGYSQTLIVPETADKAGTWVSIGLYSNGGITIGDRFAKERLGEKLSYGTSDPKSCRHRAVQLVRHGLTAADILGATPPANLTPILIALPRMPRPMRADARVARFNRSYGYTGHAA